MKISQMLKREDFYHIIQETLDYYCNRNQPTKKIRIYPFLNCIITRTPSSTVKSYIYTEYKTKASLLKRGLIWLYVHACLNSFGILSQNHCMVCSSFTNNCLIYPCNKKIRFFDFDRNIVRVILKKGFSNIEIQKEIDFRTSHEASFILPILEHTNEEYSERIINGYPLARATVHFDQLKKKAEDIWFSYIQNTIKNVSSFDYANNLHSQYKGLTDRIKKERDMDLSQTDALEQELFKVVSSANSSIPVGLSHGDLQAGNIWIENETEHVFIIDWETFDFRSIWYDQCVLNDHIRKTSSFESFAKEKDIIHSTVLYEELLFRLNELSNLPTSCDDYYYNTFITKLLSNYSDVQNS